MSIPSHTQLILPLLQTLKDKGGSARPRDLYNEIAEQFNLSGEDRNGTVNVGTRKVNAFERRVRWTRQTAVLRGLISKDEPSVWRLTETANATLGNIVRGSILTFAISENGAFLWANAEDAVGMIEKGSVQCICSSPPYPLLHPKAYGNVAPALYVDWLPLTNRTCTPDHGPRYRLTVICYRMFATACRYVAPISAICFR